MGLFGVVWGCLVLLGTFLERFGRLLGGIFRSARESLLLGLMEGYKGIFFSCEEISFFL